MHSLRKATIIFVAIFLLLLLSFVSAELNKRDPQAPPAGGAPPANGNGNQPPANGNQPAGGAPPANGNGNQPPANGNQPAGGAPPAGAPPAGGAPPANGNQPAGGAPPANGNGNQPPANGNQPAGGAPPANGNQPAGGAPPANGNQPAGGAPPANGNQPAGGAPPAGGTPAGKTPGGTPAGGTPAGGTPAGGTTPPATNNTTNSTTPIYVDPLTPSVQVQIVEPKLAKNILYKIGSNITFKWTYSADFQDPPKSISAYAQAEIGTNSNSFYAIALNITLNKTQEVTWVTANNASSLPMAKYKLWVCDERGLSVPAKPGGLQVFSGLEFGLYQSQSDSDTCPSCGLSSAISIPIIPFLSTIGFALITIISFNFILI